MVDEAVEELEAAIENLSADTDTPSQGGNTDDTSGSEDSSEKDDSSKTESPATGDNSQNILYVCAAAAILTLVGMLSIVKKRQRKSL